MFFSFIIQAPISLLLGVFTAAGQKYRAALAVLYFVPLLLSSAAVAIAFKALLDPNFGLGAGLGLPILAQDWLGNSDLVLFVVVFVIAWQFVPFHTLIYQGGVRQIPASLYEAAQIDGAGRVQQFFNITLPQLKYTIITSSTLMVVGSLAYFDLVFVLTGGGPGYATRLLPLHMYLTGFKANDMGAASALGVILVVDRPGARPAAAAAGRQEPQRKPIGRCLMASITQLPVPPSAPARPAVRPRPRTKGPGGPAPTSLAASAAGSGWPSSSSPSTTWW